jgi:hypothetical protein
LGPAKRIGFECISFSYEICITTGYSCTPWLGTAYDFQKQLRGLLSVVWKPEDILPREISPTTLEIRSTMYVSHLPERTLPDISNAG